MDKVFTYMAPFGKAVLLPFLLVYCFSSNGQVGDTLPEPIDTTIIIEEIESGMGARFESVSLEDQKPVSSRPVDRRKVAQLKQEDDFWYVDTAPEKEKRPARQKPPEQKQSPEWVRNLLWVLVVGGFVTLIIWFLMASDVKLFRKTPTVLTRHEEEEEFSTENLFDIDYDSALKKAVADQNYRLAIRLLYLQTLRELALRNIIQYRQERTNNDYLMQLFHTPYYRHFFRLTRNFEYAWYGQFPVSQPSFEQIRSEFSSFKQQMPS